MLKRNVGDKVFINPYSDITGVIIDSREIRQLPFKWDYKVKFDKPVDFGCGNQESEYYKDDELDILLQNWNAIKGIN